VNAQAYYEHGTSLRKLGRHDEAIKAFEAAITLDPGFAEAHNSRGIALASLGRYQDALVSFDQALKLNPSYAECHNNRGIVLQELGQLDAALASFDKAVALKPDNARAHNNRGTILSELRRYADAVSCYEKAIAIEPSFAGAFYNRGMALHDLGRFDDALASFDKAIALRPDYAEAHHNRGAVLQDMLRVDEAIGAYAAAIKLQPDRAESYANQGCCYLQAGRFEDGWQLREWRKRLPQPSGQRSFRQPLWLGREPISNRTLFVHWEQGFGDTIQFCRYSRLLKTMGANVVMSVQEPLYRLLTQMNPHVEVVGPAEVPGSFDYHCPMMSLPLALGTTLATIPAELRYISSDEQLRRDWDARLPPRTKPRIGIAWKGNAVHRNDRNRSIDPDMLRPLLSGNARYISLQYEDSPARPDPRLVSFAGQWRDFADTAAVIDNLDLVVAVDTAVAHLAAAMGKPTFVLLPFNSDWRWLLDRDDSPWYPSARLFRQKTGESWPDVIARVHLACTEFVELAA
jgi:tetratricopeptide (TPR) repeat protein